MSDKEKTRPATRIAAQGASESDRSSGLDDRLEDHLDDIFATARQTRPDVPQALQAAILADAATLQKSRTDDLTRKSAGQTTGETAGQTPAHRLWRQFVSAVGGWPALGGMAAASLAGLWIGLAPPSFLPDPVERYAAFSTGSQLITDLGYDVSLLMGDEVFE